MFSSPFILSFALLLSLPLLFLLAPRILPPRPLPILIPDELDDLSLFRRAALASTSPITPLQQPMKTKKIAFLFLTNSPLTFSPLWTKFFADHQSLYNIYIHADPTTPHFPTTGIFSGRFIAAKKTQRASPTLISAARRLLAAALLDDPSNYYFSLLSQHCIPLHSFRYVYHTLFSSDDQFHRHYRSFIEILSGEPTLRDRYTARGEDAMLPEVEFSEFRVGSQFFILTRQHAVLVLRDQSLWRKFRLPCRKKESCYPEEHYFPTLLSMKDPDGCTHYTLTRVNWTGSVDGHPHTYGPDEISPDLVRRLRFSNSSYEYLFARKFSPACLDPLMEIADSVIFRD